MASFACPQCKQTLRVPDTVLGRKVKCPQCGATFATRAPLPAGPSAPVVEPSKRPAAPANREQITRQPNRAAAPVRQDEEVLDVLPADPPPPSPDARATGPAVTFTVQVQKDPLKRLKGRFQATLTPDGLRLRRGKAEVLIPRNTEAEYQGRNRLAIELEGRTVQLQIVKWISYQNRLTEDLVSYLHGKRESLPARDYSLPWYLTALVVLPMGIPILTLGGALPGALGFGLCAINAAIVQREKWSSAVRALVAGGVVLLGYGGLAALVLGTVLVNAYRAGQGTTPNPPPALQHLPQPNPPGNNPLVPRPRNP
jgi:hypothetical protein